jgi:hypothetical protein
LGSLKVKKPQEEKKTNLLSLFSGKLWYQPKLWKRMRKAFMNLTQVLSL